MRSTNQPALHRRRGPDRRPALVRRLAALRPHPHRVARRRRLQRHVHLAAIGYAPVAIALTTLREHIRLPPPTRLRYVGAGMTYMWLFKVSWELPADDERRHRRRLHIDYPIQVDSALGGGMPPGQRLQRRRRGGGEVSLFDIAVSAVYGSWFVPHVLLAYMLVRHPKYLPRAAGRLAASYHLTTPFYWFVPTAPPWWASEQGGRMDGDVHRVVRHVVCKLLDRPAPGADDEVPGNPWGSMPSDHISSAAITARGLMEINPALGAIGWLYVGGAAFAVVYLGEHYVVDVLAGLAVAEAVHQAEPLAAPFVRWVAYLLE